MARPREFDTDEVLNAAMEAFWTHGYEATSLADLMEATGLQKGSIYKAFGDKHSLFLETFQRYLDRDYEMARQVFSSQPPEVAVRTFIEHTQCVGKEDSDCRKGCMFLNTIVELAPHDDDVRRIAHRQWGRMIKLVTEAIARGQKDGAFRSDVSAEHLARYLAVCAAGAATTSKARFPGLDDDDMSGVVFSALKP